MSQSQQFISKFNHLKSKTRDWGAEKREVDVEQRERTGRMEAGSEWCGASSGGIAAVECVWSGEQREKGERVVFFALFYFFQTKKKVFG
jgi:hypothetical protein